MTLTIKRILIALVVCCICVTCLLSPPAHATGVATTVAIVGSLAMSLPVISQLATMALDAANMTPALRVAAADADTPMQAFVQRTFTDFLERNALAVGTALRIASVGARYYEDGSISFDSNLSDLFGGYLDWLWAEDGGNLQASNPTAEGGFGEIDTSDINRQSLNNPSYTYDINTVYNTELPLSGNRKFTTHSPTYKVLLRYSDGSVQPYAYSETPFTLNQNLYPITGSNPWPTRSATALTYKGITYYYARLTFLNSDEINMYPNSVIYTSSGNLLTGQNAVNSVSWDIAYVIFNGAAIGDDVITDPGILSLPENKDINILKPQDKMEGAPDFGPVFDAGATVAVADYLQSVVDGIETGDFSLPTTDAATGESAGTIEGEMSQTQAMERAQALTSDLTAPGTGVVTDTAPAELGPYTLDLTAYFPFCIPWDISYMISYLQAAPEAPHFSWSLVVPGLVDYTFDIDLAVFDPVAAVLRQMELLLFAVGLAAATKSLIQGGD